LLIARGAVYFPKFGFTNSIKSVAPVLCPGFSYEDLAGHCRWRRGIRSLISCGPRFLPTASAIREPYSRCTGHWHGWLSRDRGLLTVRAVVRSGPSPDFLQNTLKRRFWRKAHGSIRIQEGEPPSNPHFVFSCHFPFSVKPCDGFDTGCSRFHLLHCRRGQPFPVSRLRVADDFMVPSRPHLAELVRCRGRVPMPALALFQSHDAPRIARSPLPSIGESPALTSAAAP
jgi:hypothetical protein